MTIGAASFVMIAIILTACTRSNRGGTPTPVTPTTIINPSDAAPLVDASMEFVLSDLIRPARAKISDLHETPDEIKRQFQYFLQWQAIVANALQSDVSVQGSAGPGTMAMQEFTMFSGIQYQCDTRTGCRDLLGAAAEVESANLNNTAKSLADQFHGQPVETRKAAADYFSKNFSLF